MAIEINEINIRATISEQEAIKPNTTATTSVDVEAIVSLAVEAVLEILKEQKED